MNTDIENVFLLNNEHEIYKFCKVYASNNQKFAAILIERFLPKKGGTSKKQFNDIDKELELCFNHINEKSNNVNWEPDLDWDAISGDLLRLVGKGRYMLNNGLVAEAGYLALELLRNVCKNYDEDVEYEDQDLDGDYFCTDAAILLLKETIALSSMTQEELLRIAGELEEIGEFEACKSYGLCNFDNLIESIKKSQFSEEIYVKYLRSEMNKATDYSKDDYAIKLFHFLLERNHCEEAENWAKENIEYYRLLDVYVDWLIGEQRFKDAILTLDIVINDNAENNRCQSEWMKKKLEIYESQHDTTHIIELCYKLFITDHNAIVYYRKLKSHIDTTEWSDYLDKLLAHRKFSGDACDIMSQIYYEEKCNAELFQMLNMSSRNLLDALQKYANDLTEEQQTILIVKIENALISFAEDQIGRSNYQVLARRLKMLKGCCKIGQVYSKKLVELFRDNYRNRHAMLDELRGL